MTSNGTNTGYQPHNYNNNDPNNRCAFKVHTINKTGKTKRPNKKGTAKSTTCQDITNSKLNPLERRWKTVPPPPPPSFPSTVSQSTAFSGFSLSRRHLSANHQKATNFINIFIGVEEGSFHALLSLPVLYPVGSGFLNTRTW